MPKKFEVKRIFGSEGLPPEIERMGLSENGHGSEWASYILIYIDGKLDEWYSDAMEPEDAIFCRDLDWISAALERAYKLGGES